MAEPSESVPAAGDPIEEVLSRTHLELNHFGDDEDKEDKHTAAIKGTAYNSMMETNKEDMRGFKGKKVPDPPDDLAGLYSRSRHKPLLASQGPICKSPRQHSPTPETPEVTARWMTELKKGAQTYPLPDYGLLDTR